MRRNLTKFIPVLIMVTMMTWGCAQDKMPTSNAAMKSTAAQQKEVNVYKGKIAGKSNKAKTISIVPEGVTEIKPKDVKKLIDSNADVMIIDSRPAKRYAQSHLPGAVLITVGQMKTAPKNLPADKNKLLLFYCGGYT